MPPKAKERAPLFIQSRIPHAAEVGHRTNADGKREFIYPVIDSKSIEDWNLGEILQGVNQRINPARIGSYVKLFKACKTPNDFKQVEIAIDTELSKDLGMGFMTKLQLMLFNLRIPIPVTQEAAEKDMALGFSMARIRMRYIVEAVFSSFDAKTWEEEFLDRQTCVPEGSNYTLVEYFKEKCAEIFSAEPLRTFMQSIELRDDPEAVEKMNEMLAGNFIDGMSHLPRIKKILESPAELKKKVRQMMVMNAATRLFNALIMPAEGYSYFWKPLSAFLEQAPASPDIMMQIACDEEGILQTARGRRPTLTCPVHYLPPDIFDGLIDLMLKYPEYTPKQNQLLRALFA